MPVTPNEIDKIEILALQDNYIDLLAQDSNDIVTRALPVKDGEVKTTILAEHGFASIITVTKGGRSRSILFDFGFSETGAALNAQAMDLDLSVIEATAISHGHLDHVGGMVELMKMVGKKNVDLVLHPEAFRNPRYLKVSEEIKHKFLSFTREKAELAGLNVVEAADPYPMLDGDIVFLGSIPRETEYEKGAPNLYFGSGGEIKRDDFADDTSLVADLKGKGLVVISGCAHSGIINTVRHAQRTTGVDTVFAVYGGFHLAGKNMEAVVEHTVAALQEIDPEYIVPVHCTGRAAITSIEKLMPEKLLINMAGTRITFST
jgi:7,8-dihydropterin-6-yl-methyl-4-(beta-D-ribofuranosyl)aminobenzene 5'-phosphate synthase